MFLYVRMLYETVNYMLSHVQVHPHSVSVCFQYASQGSGLTQIKQTKKRTHCPLTPAQCRCPKRSACSACSASSYGHGAAAPQAPAPPPECPRTAPLCVKKPSVVIARSTVAILLPRPDQTERERNCRQSCTRDCATCLRACIAGLRRRLRPQTPGKHGTLPRPRTATTRHAAARSSRDHACAKLIMEERSQEAYCSLRRRPTDAFTRPATLRRTPCQVLVLGYALPAVSAACCMSTLIESLLPMPRQRPALWSQHYCASLPRR